MKAIFEVIKEASEASSRDEKTKILKSYPYQEQLKQILKNTYDKNVKFLVQAENFLFTPSQFYDIEGALVREVRKLPYIIAGKGYDELNQLKREGIFKEILETVHKGDAELLVNMVQQKPIKGITVALLNEVYGEDFIPQSKKEEKN